MDTVNTLNKRKKRLGFAFTFSAAIVLTVFLFATILHEDPEPVEKKIQAHTQVSIPAANNILETSLALVNSQADALDLLDKQYIGLASIRANKKQLDTVTAKINEQEKKLRILMDSIYLRTTVQLDAGQQKLMSSLLSGYRTMLNNHHSVISIASK